MCVLEGEQLGRKIKFYFPCLYNEFSGSVILSRCSNTLYPSPLTAYWITSLGLFGDRGKAEILTLNRKKTSGVPTGKKAITDDSLIIYQYY